MSGAAGAQPSASIVTKGHNHTTLQQCQGEIHSSHDLPDIIQDFGGFRLVAVRAVSQLSMAVPTPGQQLTRAQQSHGMAPPCSHLLHITQQCLGTQQVWRDIALDLRHGKGHRKCHRRTECTAKVPTRGVKCYSYVGQWQHYMTNHQICFVWQKRKKQQRQSKWKCKSSAICFVFALLLLFPGTTSALMRSFTRQQYLLYAPRTKAEKKRTNAKIKQTKATNTHSCICLLFCLLYLLLFFASCLLYKLFWLLVSVAGAPDIMLQCYRQSWCSSSLLNAPIQFDPTWPTRKNIQPTSARLAKAFLLSHRLRHIRTPSKKQGPLEPWGPHLRRRNTGFYSSRSPKQLRFG